MVLDPFEAGIGVAATVALAAAAVGSRALTLGAGVTAAAFGSVIVVAGGFPFLALLVLFVVGSVLATRYGFEEKKRRSVQEGTEGERGVPNVLAHIIVPTALVGFAAFFPRSLPLVPLATLYTAALGFGAADTFASEFGVLAGTARSILTLRPVSAGTNGGVSAIGEFWALVGALTTAVLAVVLFDGFQMSVSLPGVFLLSAAVAGFVGCQVDSVLGETLENRGYLTKGTTNFLSMSASVAIAGAILLGFGVAL